MSDLNDLVLRCRSASGEDRALDVDISLGLGHNPSCIFGSCTWGTYPEYDCHFTQSMKLSDAVAKYPEWRDEAAGCFGVWKFTSSLDDLSRLIEARLPDWSWKITKESDGCRCVLRKAPNLDEVAPAWVQTADTPALALCAAYIASKASPTPETMER